jgi:phospholipase C
MSDSRREFIKKATLLTGAAGIFNVLPSSIQKAMAIDAAPGSTYMDAEHVVFLMQENRSFDHCFGTLKGVRGFNDPRAIRLANQNPVWLQSNAEGKTYAPFRLNLKDTNATWMNSLPHSWENQVDASNGGKHDRWLDSKKSGNKRFAEMPLTMGYYNREDLPYYYALADAFTVCDQHFCSSLTGTSPNRLFFLSGTIREQQNEESPAHLWNDQIDHKDLHWTTFPERLEELGISWKTYQNELSIPVGFEGEEEEWLANFTDNDLEFFKQFNVRLHPEHLDFMEKYALKLKEEITLLQTKIKKNASDKGLADQLQKKEEKLLKVKADQQIWNKTKFEQLSAQEKSIHQKAFVTNSGDPDYHQLVDLSYDDNGTQRTMKVPKGDVLHQFRQDVEEGKLPTVSWLVPPCNFSDHPGAPWYGAWYISEVMDILTKNEEVWKKTIFILTYDENDGYFDHIPPFLPPHTDKPETGKASNGIDTRVEHVSMEQEMAGTMKEKRESAVGLGFRVPMVVVSPWTKGGWVNSEVFDHTSNLQFLEHLLSAKTGKKVLQPQISDWRRTVTGNLTSVFRTADQASSPYPDPIAKQAFMQGIYNAKFKALPAGFHAFSNEEIAQAKTHTLPSGFLPVQEKGVKPSSALPYQLYVSANYDAAIKGIKLDFESRDQVFGSQTAGAPFTLYLPGKTVQKEKDGHLRWGHMHSRNYAVKSRDHISDLLPLDIFEDANYHIQVYGPNGYFREFKGNSADPEIQLSCEYQQDRINIRKLSGNVELKLFNLNPRKTYEVTVIDHAYGTKPKNIRLTGKGKAAIVDLTSSYGWYDFSVFVKGNSSYEHRFAGRVETGKPSYTDPFMGRALDSTYDL